MKKYRIILDSMGKPQRGELLTPLPEGWSEVIIEVEDHLDMKSAFLIAAAEYARSRKKRRMEELKVEGRCRCGRVSDRPGFRMCSVCEVRQKVWNGKHKEGASRSEQPRDEKARVEKNLERQRDRRGEIRIEVLIEVRKAWENAPNNGAFSQWLKAEILKETQPKLRVV